jgi:hypothetical protein
VSLQAIFSGNYAWVLFRTGEYARVEEIGEICHGALAEEDGKRKLLRSGIISRGFVGEEKIDL